MISFTRLLRRPLTICLLRSQSIRRHLRQKKPQLSQSRSVCRAPRFLLVEPVWIQVWTRCRLVTILWIKIRPRLTLLPDLSTSLKILEFHTICGWVKISKSKDEINSSHQVINTFSPVLAFGNGSTKAKTEVFKKTSHKRPWRRQKRSTQHRPCQRLRQTNSSHFILSRISNNNVTS